MTKNEAIKNIETYINKCSYTWTVKSIFDEYVKYLQGSYYVSYTATDIIQNCHRSLEMLAIKALQEVQEYRKLGTLEEVGEAVEKQKAKKVNEKGGRYKRLSCPVCGRVIGHVTPPIYCEYCGQKIEENNGDQHEKICMSKLWF